MSQLLSLPSLDLLLITGRAIALLLGLFVFAWAFRHWRRAAMRDTQRVFEQLDLVRSELLIMKEVMHHASHRSDTPARTTTYEERVEARSSAPVVGIARGYETAARMARNGADKDELMRGCGVTSHEAELLVKLHGQRRDPAALIGRQPRAAEAAPASVAATRQSAASNQAPDSGRQAASVSRQGAAAANTQRTPERASTPVKSSLPPRSRLVAVG